MFDNLQLYDLYTGQYSKGENHVNGCPDEDMVCLNSLEGPRCGRHGICELTDALNKQYKCTCKPGYRTAGPGKENCDIRKLFMGVGGKTFTVKIGRISNTLKNSCNSLKLEQCDFYHRVMCPKDSQTLLYGTFDGSIVAKFLVFS